jgi:HK97 family phage major capsid protein
MITQTVSTLPKGTAAARLIKTICDTRGNLRLASEVAENYRSSPAVALTLKAAVSAGNTSGMVALAPYGVDEDLLQLYRSRSVFGSMQNRMRRAPFRTSIATESTAGNSGWISESDATVVTALSLSSVRLESYKLGQIVVFSKELIEVGGPDAEASIRRVLTDTLADFTDQQFLTKSVAINANYWPASITKNGGVVTSTGSTVALIEADLNNMLNTLGTWGAPHWVLHPRTAAWLSAKLGAPGMSANILGIPFATTTAVTNQISLVDFGDILFNEGSVEISNSTEAAILLDDNPNASPQTTALVLLYQRNLYAIRIVRYVSWIQGHSNSTVSMSVTY